MSIYRGQCHCGKVKFEVDTDLDRVVRCNCSLCRRRSALMTYAHENDLRIIDGEDALGLYQFHTMQAKHYFCRTCGIYPFHRTRRFPDKYGVNIGCLEGVDPYNFEPELIDGVSFD